MFVRTTTRGLEGVSELLFSSRHAGTQENVHGDQHRRRTPHYARDFRSLLRALYFRFPALRLKLHD
jgi:hypothetical protein